MIVCGAVSVLVAVLLIGFCIRYRRRPGEVGNPPPTQQSSLLEWTWTLSPLAIFMVMFAWGSNVYFSAFVPPNDATPVYVVAKQWMWKFQHLEGQREIDTLHVPVGNPIKLLMISEDVIHSFFVPAFRVHMDVLPQPLYIGLVSKPLGPEFTTCFAPNTAVRTTPAWWAV